MAVVGNYSGTSETVGFNDVAFECENVIVNASEIVSRSGVDGTSTGAVTVTVAGAAMSPAAVQSHVRPSAVGVRVTFGSSHVHCGGESMAPSGEREIRTLTLSKK